MKHLCFVVLFAFCLGVAGLAEAADGWVEVSHNLPATLEWEASAPVSVLVENTGSTTWDGNYLLRSVVCPTTAARLADVWGLTSVPVTSITVPPAAEYLFEFTIVAPPITPLRYTLPLTPTQTAGIHTLSCDWMLMHGDALMGTDAVQHAVALSRFPDDQPGSAGAWARFWIEELAGRVPVIVGGYRDGTYRPALQVTRDQMAVFVQRAMKLPLGTYAGDFSDVPLGYWADDQIQSCVDAGIAGGYGDGTYRPTLVVNRDAMAVFMARGIAGGDSEVPSGPATATFPDVPTDYWAYKYIEYAVASNVVGGYPSGNYLPTLPVDRGQMAVFIYRGFVAPTGSVVLWAGPAISRVDPYTADHLGWSSASSAPADDPGSAYVLVDAARLSTDMAPLDIRFELRGPETPTPTATETFDAAEIQTAIDNISTQCGCPWLISRWNLPTGLAPGEYTLVVSIAGNEVARQPEYTVTE